MSTAAVTAPGHAEEIALEGPTLEEAILETWNELERGVAAECLLCGGEIESASRCHGCGGELS